MTATAILLVAFGLSPFASLAQMVTAEKKTANNAVAIEKVLAEIKTALARVQTRLDENQLPPLKAVKLTFQTIASKKGGVVVKLWIISFGQTWQRERSQEVVIELVPPSPGAALQVSTVAEQLENAILNAAEGVKKAGEGNVPLRIDKLNLILGFVVEGEKSAGGKIDIVPVTLELAGSLKDKAIHKIEVTFSSSKP